MLRRWPLVLRPLAWLAMVPGWIWGAWVSSGQVVRSYPSVAAPTGRARIWTTALRYSFSPREVVEYGLAAPGTDPGPWFCEHEMYGIWEHLAAAEARELAADKLSFAGFCADHGLPHARTLAVWNRGTGDVNPAVWRDGMVLKPMASNNAQGFEAWEREGDVYLRGGDRLSPDALAARGATLSLDWGVMLAQPLLVLHPDLAARGLQGMPVARLITGLWPDGRTDLFEAYYSAPMPGSAASNAGYGPKWPVDISDGRIEDSLSPLLPHGLLPNVPGAILPGWDTAVAAVLKGHAAFPYEVPVLGWDVAFTGQGPVLLETNTGISLAVPQGTRQRPAGREPIAELIDAWLTGPAPS